MNTRMSPVFSDYGPEEEALQAYCREGSARAEALGNRGPIRFGADGKLDPAILESYRRHGFYIFEGVLKPGELADIEADLFALMDRFPVAKGAALDAKGRPALAATNRAPCLVWIKPLSDPIGGTAAAHGRHPVKMFEPKPADGAPEHIVQLILGSLQFSDAALRVYGHPDLLRVAEAVHGPDFVPFNEAIWIKEPGKGGPVSWHQDGWTHWNSPELDGDTHGFNFMAQLYGCTPANGLWVVPGSHRMGKVDIRRWVEEARTERLPQAVPLVCQPGDVAICNRQAVHGSFANTSPNWRVTINFGFHRRRSVLGVESGGVHNAITVYDAERIAKRSRAIGYGIAARRQRFPDETPYVYAPHVASSETFTWDGAARAELHDYNLLDLGI